MFTTYHLSNNRIQQDFTELPKVFNLEVRNPQEKKYCLSLNEFLTCTARYTSILQVECLLFQYCHCQKGFPKEHWTKAEDNWNQSKGECLNQIFITV